MSWMLRVVPLQLHGGLRGRSVLTSEIPQAIYQQQAMEEGVPMLGVTHDRQKCFDLFKSELVLLVFAALGLDRRFVALLSARYRSMKRVFRYGKSFGKWWASQSLLQGCCTSVLVCNVMFGLLARRISKTSPLVAVNFYLDDSKLRSRLRDVKQLEVACQQFRFFDIFSGQQVNGKKCTAFGTTTEARKAAAKLLPQGGQVVLHAVSLGVVVPTSKKGFSKIANARVEPQLLRLKRVARFPGTKDEKTAIVESSVLPSILHGVFIACPTEEMLGRLRSAVLAAVFSTGAACPHGLCL